jgi:hypothetical protein
MQLKIPLRDLELPRTELRGAFVSKSPLTHLFISLATIAIAEIPSPHEFADYLMRLFPRLGVLEIKAVEADGNHPEESRAEVFEHIQTFKPLVQFIPAEWREPG